MYTSLCLCPGLICHSHDLRSKAFKSANLWGPTVLSSAEHRPPTQRDIFCPAISRRALVCSVWTRWGCGWQSERTHPQSKWNRVVMIALMIMTELMNQKTSRAQVTARSHLLDLLFLATGSSLSRLPLTPCWVFPSLCLKSLWAFLNKVTWSARGRKARKTWLCV